MSKPKADKTYLFETARVPRAVFSLAIPAVISQIISLVYNMADTFFVGQLGDPNQVAAVSLVAPMMLALTALANLFGIGAASTASRFLGAKNPDSSRRATSFGFYAALVIAVLLSVSALIFPGFFLDMLGAVGDMRSYAGDYLFWVISLGAAPMLLSMVLSHFIRADGAAKTAGFALSAGGVINLILDPLFIFDFGLGMGVKGAAFATFIANMFTLLYFLRYYYVSRKDTVIGLHPRWFTMKREIAGQVVMIGLPGMLQTLLASVSNTMLNQLVKGFGGEAVAAMGIVKKIDTVPMSVTIGIAQGVMPLLGYNYAAKETTRMRKAANYALLLAIGFSVICVAVFIVFASFFIKLFIQEETTISYGIYFLRIMCISTPMMAVGFHMITLFQAVGESRPALVLSVLRKGVVDIPLMLLLNFAVPLFGLAFVQPAAEFIAMAVAILFYARFTRRWRSLSQ